METYYDKEFMTIIEVPDFRKSLHELETDDDGYLFIFNHLEELTEVPAFFAAHPTFSQVFAQAAFMNLSQEEQAMYRKDWEVEMDRKSEKAQDRDEGREEGIEIGVEIGIEQGREQGREQGVI